MQVLRGAWTYSPGSPTTEGSIVPDNFVNSGDYSPLWYRFGFEGSYFIFGINGQTTPVVMSVNGMDWPNPIVVVTNGTDLNWHYFKVSFSSRARRQIVLQTAQVGGGGGTHAQSFAGVWIEKSTRSSPSAVRTRRNQAPRKCNRLERTIFLCRTLVGALI